MSVANGAGRFAAGELVVFDFDGTMFRGDSGYAMVAWMLRRNMLRLAVALMVSPIALPLLLSVATRQQGISMFLWIATFASPIRDDADALVARYVEANGDALRKRVFPQAVETLDAHRSRGDTVVVATGAADGLARAILHLAGYTDLPVVGSISKPDMGGRVIAQHCHAANKLRMLRAQIGIDAADRGMAYSDSPTTCRCCAQRCEPVVVNPNARDAAKFRRELGADVPILDWRQPG